MEFGNDERQARILCRKVAQFNAAIVGQWQLAAQIRLSPTAVDLRLNLAHLFIGDNQKVAGAAGRVKHADARHTRET